MDDQPNNQPPKPNREPELPPQQQEPAEGSPDIPKEPVVPQVPSDINEVPPTSIEPPTQPTPTPLGDTSISMQPPVAPRNRRRGLAAFIIAAVILLLAGAAWAVYALWYQHPQKVVSDALVKAIQSETLVATGTLKSEGSTPVTVTFDTKINQSAVSADFGVSATNGAQQIKVDGAVIANDQNEFYVKVKNLREVLQSQLGTIPPEASQPIEDFVVKVNDKWVKIVLGDFGVEISEEQKKTQTCMKDALAKIRSDKAIGEELTKVYKEQKYFTVGESLGTINGAIGYKIALNDNEAGALAEALKNTQAYKLLHDCDQDFTLDANSFKSEEIERMELWIDQWSHELKKVVINAHGTDASEKFSLTAEPTFNAPVSIETPTDFVELKTLMEDVQTLMTALSSNNSAVEEDSLFN